MYSVKDALIKATHELKEVCDIPNKEARILLAFYLQKDQLWLITHDNEKIVDKDYFELIKRRIEKLEKTGPKLSLVDLITVDQRYIDWYIACHPLSLEILAHIQKWPSSNPAVTLNHSPC